MLGRFFARALCHWFEPVANQGNPTDDPSQIPTFLSVADDHLYT